MRRTLAFAFCLVAISAVAQSHWVVSWTASPMARTETAPDSAEQTIREIIHPTLSGTEARITLSNKLGNEPLTVGGADVALSLGGSAVDPRSHLAITFAGKPSATIAPGATLQSDPIAMRVQAFTNLAVTLFLPAQKISSTTLHGDAEQTIYRAPGNHLTNGVLPNATEDLHWYFLTNLDVMAPPNAAAVVTFGDSITDGFRSTVNANHRYPDFLASRLQADPVYAHLGVANTGISGGRVLHDGVGPSALKRFDTDVLAQAGAKYLILLEGINDVGRFLHPRVPEDKITADQIIAGYVDLIQRAHAKGIKVYGATLIPFLAAADQTPESEGIRLAVNKFIRTSGKFDAVIDFDKVIADPANPHIFRQDLDCGDHVHPNDIGYKAMADSIDLSLFLK